MVTTRGTFPREGFYVDPLASFIRKTLLNPYLAIPALALLHGSRNLWPAEANSILLEQQVMSRLVKTFTYLASFGGILSINEYLSHGYLNNWTKKDIWNWPNEIILVTGGSSGIGASVVQQLMALLPETQIVVVDYSPIPYQLPAGSKVHYYQCDLSKAEAIKSICKEIKDEIGSPTVLLNNAGLLRGKTVMDGTYADTEITIRTNLIAPFLLIKEFLPDMVKRDHGHVIGISSASTFVSPAGLADYAATKAGILKLHQTLRQELRFRHGAPRVRVSTVIPSFIDTPMFRGETKQSHFLTPLMHVDTVGETIVNIILGGYSKTVWLPGIIRYVAWIQNGPEWMYERMIMNSAKFGTVYEARQKIDDKTATLID